jgi:hypothetical protein
MCFLSTRKSLAEIRDPDCHCGRIRSRPCRSPHNCIYHDQLPNAQANAIKAPKRRFSCCRMTRQGYIVVVVFYAAYRSPESETKIAVILLFGLLNRLSYLASTLIYQFELNRVEGYRVVLLENFYDSTRWDVLLAGREVISVEVASASILQVPDPFFPAFCPRSTLYSRNPAGQIHHLTTLRMIFFRTPYIVSHF